MKRASSWERVIRLGLELLDAGSIALQRDLILGALQDLCGCQVILWLDESLFRLPGPSIPSLFPAIPPTEFIRQAVETGRSPFPSNSVCSSIVFLIENQDDRMGAFQVDRQDKPFTNQELDTLKGLAGHIALALYTTHRRIVEQWRIEQLTLVRQVSAQIATVTDLDALARQVTALIQETYSYYYVAAFTCEPGQDWLKFRSSARPDSDININKNKAKPSRLKVRIGEGMIGQVALSGQEILSNDISIEPRFRYVEDLQDTRSEFVLPLKIENRVLGVLDVQSDRLDAFHPNDLLVLRALADTLAVALDGARLYGALEKRAAQLALVAAVSDDITYFLDLEDLLKKVSALIHERVGYPYVHLFTVHQNRRQIIYEAGCGKRNQRYSTGYILNLDSGEGIIPWVARNGQTVLANDVSKEPLYRPSPIPPEDTRSEMTVALMYDNTVIGILDLQSDRRNAFDEDDRFLCEALADNVAVAIHNADLYRTERWRRQVSEGLREVAGLLSADVGVDDVLDAILVELEKNLPCQVSAIWLKEGEELYLGRIRGADSAEVEAAAREWPESGAYLAEAIGSYEPVVRKPTDPIGPTGAALGFAADYSSIAASLRVGDQPVGVLTLTHPSSGRYGHEAQAMTATFASYAAVAIQNARLYDSAQEQAYASAALLQVAQTVATSATLAEVLSSIARILPILVGIKACGIYLWQKDVFHPVESYGFTPQVEDVLIHSDFPTGSFRLLDMMQETLQPAFGILASTAPEDWINPVLPQSDEEIQYILESGDHLLMTFPLAIKGVLYGALLVEETSTAIRFRAKRVEILTSIAQEMALSIQNEHLQGEMVARERLEHEIALARQIQRTFLPETLPVYPGWDLAAVWKTARQVGGDFYDVFNLPDGHLGMLIADVSDKGIPAALFMALTRTLIRAAVLDSPSPADVLRRVNDLIIPDNQQSMFISVVYAVLSLEEGELTYANAGHNPPLWLHSADGNIQALKRTGMALGVVEHTPFEQHSFRVNLGDTLLFYTDGLTEAFSPDQDLFGEKRLRRILRSHATGSGRSLLDALESSVNDFMGPLPPADDMTLLVLRRDPSASSA